MQPKLPQQGLVCLRPRGPPLCPCAAAVASGANHHLRAATVHFAEAQQPVVTWHWDELVVQRFNKIRKNRWVSSPTPYSAPTPHISVIAAKELGAVLHSVTVSLPKRQCS